MAEQYKWCGQKHIALRGSDKTNIKLQEITTKAGNVLTLFYNPDHDTIVLDLIDKHGGIELLRQTLNEKELLNHCAD